MFVPSGFNGLGRWQSRLLRTAVVLSVLFHGAVLALGSVTISLFPSHPFLPVVTVELTEAPLSELPEEPPARPEPAKAADSAPVAKPATPPVRPSPPAEGQKWLARLDRSLARIPDAPVTRGSGRTGGIPVRQFERSEAPRPGDFAPAVGPEHRADLRKELEERLARLMASRSPSVAGSEESVAVAMFGGIGDSAGEAVPAWIQEMIRRRVRGFLPELERAYTDAYRKNPDLQGKMIVRFRIEPSGRVAHAESVDHSFRDAPFEEDILRKVRRWTFDPPGGWTVEVVYPFVFVAPS